MSDGYHLERMAPHRWAVRDPAARIRGLYSTKRKAQAALASMQRRQAGRVAAARAEVQEREMSARYGRRISVTEIRDGDEIHLVKRSGVATMRVLRVDHYRPARGGPYVLVHHAWKYGSTGPLLLLDSMEVRRWGSPSKLA